MPEASGGTNTETVSIFPVLACAYGDSPWSGKLACACGHSAINGCWRCGIQGTRLAPDGITKLGATSYGGYSANAPARTYDPSKASPWTPQEVCYTREGHFDRSVAADLKCSNALYSARARLADVITSEELAKAQGVPNSASDAPEGMQNIAQHKDSILSTKCPVSN